MATWSSGPVLSFIAFAKRNSPAIVAKIKSGEPGLNLSARPFLGDIHHVSSRPSFGAGCFMVSLCAHVGRPRCLLDYEVPPIGYSRRDSVQHNVLPTGRVGTGKVGSWFDPKLANDSGHPRIQNAPLAQMQTLPRRAFNNTTSAISHNLSA